MKLNFYISKDRGVLGNKCTKEEKFEKLEHRSEGGEKSEMKYPIMEWK